MVWHRSVHEMYFNTAGLSRLGLTAEDFAAEVVRLYRYEDLWNHVSAAGLENVRQYFSVETATLGLQELLNSLD